EIYENKTEYENHGCTASTGTLFFTGHTGELITVTGRQRFLSYFLHCLDSLPGTVAVSGGTVDSHSSKHIESLDIIRSVDTFNAHELSDGCHFISVAHLDGFQGFKVGTAIGICLDH